ncbi:hypothetical protein FXF69_31930 [Actinomadura chibensis]|uniref:Uncharacterized protein n=1 Tax=Actinomadura chibensis TaxID=392828 RepID=A0A5D0NDA5_9ACTN|nr:hypothetical protein FXF69_31930 [Actinomadura chibensis]
MMFSRVDFPQPDAPTRHVNVPSAIARSIPSRARAERRPWMKSFVTFRTVIALIAGRPPPMVRTPAMIWSVDW